MKIYFLATTPGKKCSNLSECGDKLIMWPEQSKMFPAVCLWSDKSKGLQKNRKYVKVQNLKRTKTIQ
jgi:hypothetical protein